MEATIIAAIAASWVPTSAGAAALLTFVPITSALSRAGYIADIQYCYLVPFAPRLLPEFGRDYAVGITILTIKTFFGEILCFDSLSLFPCWPAASFRLVRF